MSETPFTGRDIIISGIPYGRPVCKASAFSGYSRPAKASLLRGTSCRGSARISEDLYDLAGWKPSRSFPGPRLAGQFDPLLHGWSSNTEILAGHTSIVTTNGLFKPFTLVHGRAVAKWGLAGGRITIRPSNQSESPLASSLQTAAANVLDYLGMPAAPPSFDP